MGAGRKLLIFGITWCWMLPGHPQCHSLVYNVSPGEKIAYDVAYNWGLIWINAGEVYFKADTGRDGFRPVYLFESYGQSLPFYDWIYKVRDRYESSADPESLLPAWFRRNTSEGGYWVRNRYRFDQDRGRVFASIEHSDRPLHEDTLDLPACTMDVLTAIYYTRCIDISGVAEGDRIPIRFVIDGEFYDLYLRYLGKETATNRDSKSYPCMKFSAMLVAGTIFKGGEDMVVWVTDDRYRIPVIVEAKILVGSVVAYLTGYENPETGHTLP